MKIATKWEVKVNGKERSIQLYDKEGKKIDGDNARWDGDFCCSNNQLTSLDGAPKEVGGIFDCSGNKLTSLDGAPKEVGGGFYCEHNQLTKGQFGNEKFKAFFKK